MPRIELSFDRVNTYKREIAMYNDQIVELEAEAQNIGSTLNGEVRLHGSVKSDTLQIKCNKLIDRKEQLQKRIEVRKKYISDIELLIENIKDDKTREIFKYRILEGMAWKEVAREVDKSDDHVRAVFSKKSRELSQNNTK